MGLIRSSQVPTAILRMMIILNKGVIGGGNGASSNQQG